MRPKYRNVELLETTNRGVSVTAVERAEALEKAIGFAKKAFGNTYESRKGEAGNDFYVASTRTFVGANNFNGGDIGALMIGHFVEILFRTPVFGKPFQSWLLQPDSLPTGAVASKYFMYEKPNTKLTGCDDAQDLPANLPTNSSEYFLALSACVKGINESFDKQKIGRWRESEINLRIAYVRALYKILQSRTNLVAYDSFANYCRDSLGYILCFMTRALANDLDDLPVVEWKKTKKPYDMFEVLNDPTKMLEMFENWYYARLEEDLEKTVRTVYTIDLKNMKVDNGVIQTNGGVFDKMIDYVLKGALSWSAEAVRFKMQLTSLRACYTDFVQYGFVLDHEHSSVVIPRALLALYHGKHKDFQVKGDLIEIESQVKFWIKTMDLVLSEFQTFVTEFFDTDTAGYMFPNASVRKTVKNGIPSYYRFDFSSSVRDTFMELKLVPHAMPNGRVQYDAEPLGIFNVEKGTCSVKEDRYVQPLYERMNGTQFFGTDKLTKEERNAIVDQFRTYEVLQTGKDSWKVEYKPVIYTIKPPLDTARDFDIYAGSSVRGVPGLEYRLEELPVQTSKDVEQLSMLDLWFAVRIHEVNSSAEMESIYRKRVSMFGDLKDFMPSYKVTSFTGAKVGTPMYGALLALGGVTGSKTLTSTFAIRPQYFGAPIGAMVSGSKQKKVALNRKVVVKVPVHTTAINKDYFAKAKGNVIYESAESRFKGTNLEAPFFLLTKDPFDEVCWKNYVTATFCLDAAFDIEFQNATKVYRDSNQIELYLNSGMPGFDSVDSGFDERYVVIGYNDEDPRKRYRVCDDFSEFYSSPLLKTDVTETFAGCLKNAFLEALFNVKKNPDVAKAASEAVDGMLDWMCQHFNLDENSMMNVVPEFYSDVTVKDVRAASKKFATATKRDEVASFFKKLFSVGGDALKEVPELAHPDYIVMLKSALYGSRKFLRNARPISVTLSRLPGDLIKDVDIVGKMANILAAKELNMDAINV